MTFKLNQAWVTAFQFQMAEALDALDERILATAVAGCPVSKPERHKSGSKRGLTVIVEIGPDKRPRIAKGVGSPTSASASRYIKTKKLSELTPLAGNAGLFTYTFARHQSGTLKKSGKIVPADDFGTGARGGVIFTAPYAKFVHDGTRHMQGRAWLLAALESHRDEIASGQFLKR